jgi:hypothetical protein
VSPSLGFPHQNSVYTSRFRSYHSIIPGPSLPV